jgi:ATP-dependent protease ClpP protease subunit
MFEDRVVINLGRLEKEVTFTEVSGELEHLIDCDDPEKMRPLICINSHGGIIEEALSLYSYIKAYPMPVDGLALGFVESAAIYVFLACRKRVCTPTTIFMLHEAFYSYKGTSRQMRHVMQDISLKEKLYRKIVCDEVGVSRQIVNKWLTHGFSFDANTAKNLGFVHEITSDIPVTPALNKYHRS